MKPVDTLFEAQFAPWPTPVWKMYLGAILGLVAVFSTALFFNVGMGWFDFCRGALGISFFMLALGIVKIELRFFKYRRFLRAQCGTVHKHLSIIDNADNLSKREMDLVMSRITGKAHS